MNSGAWTAISGALFAVSFLAATLVLDIPGHDDSERAVNDFYDGSGGRIQVIAGSYLLVLSGLSFLAFVPLLAHRADRGDSPLRTVAISAGAVASALFLASAAAHSPSYVAYVEFFDEPNSELRRGVIPHIALSLQMFGVMAAAASVFLACLLLREAKGVAGWIAWTGFAAAAVSLLSLFYMPMFVLPLWVLAASVSLALRRPDEATTAP
jgi:hypothetical protein